VAAPAEGDFSKKPANTLGAHLHCEVYEGGATMFGFGVMGALWPDVRASLGGGLLALLWLADILEGGLGNWQRGLKAGFLK